MDTQAGRRGDTVAMPASEIAPGVAAAPVRVLEPPKPRRVHLEPGFVLASRYEIVRLLGEGGMGAVYKARDRELDRVVAVKVVRPEYSSHRETVWRLKQELILARQVTHHNVIRIFDIGLSDDGRRFISMEYVEGRDLRTILRERRKLAPTEAAKLFHQALEGLEAAHNEGVIHRDLKPQNVLVEPGGRVVLMDFGVARALDAGGMTRTGVLVGTPDYMSPEQAMGEKLDTRSDLFSAGVVLYELLTGVTPYHEKTMMATLIRRTTERAVPPRTLDASIPQYLSDIVARCLEIDREARYQTTGEILRDLDAGRASTAGGASSPSEASADALRPGARLGSRYVIETLLGEGGMGKVYRAMDVELGRTAALKMVRPELTANARAMELLKQEILLASRISHKNILRIYDLGEADGLKFISMAFVDGEDLFRRLERAGALPLDAALRIARQIARALEAAHGEGIVHRDLKPQNVLLGAGDQVYVADFGLARPLEEGVAAGSGEVMGTPRYMSPEQASSQPLDHRTDLYSFGLILFEMLTGDAPFASETVMQTVYARVTRPPRSPKLLRPDLPDHYARIVLKCLERDPARRYQSAAEILADLDAEPGERRVLTIGVPAWRKAAAVAAAVLLAATAGLFAVPRTREAILEAVGYSAAPAPLKYVAVLPFRATGEGGGLDDAALGITDALDARLRELKSVSVSVGSRADLTKPLDQIGRLLGAQLVLDGTVEGNADKLGVVVNLDEVATGRRLWSEEFTGARQDLLTLQDQIYAKLLDKLAVGGAGDALSRGATRLTTNVAAYELYLKARSLVRKNADAAAENAALALYAQAVQQDPRFALAYAGIADANMGLFHLTKDGAWTERALGAARRAEDLNDSLPEVHNALARVYLATGRTGQALAELKRSLDMEPNSDTAWSAMSAAHLAAGQKDLAIQDMRRTVDINPYYWRNYNELGNLYWQLGDNDNALSAFRRVTELEPGLAIGWTNLGAVLFRMTRWDESVTAFKQSLQIDPAAGTYSNLGTAYYFLGRFDEARNMDERAVRLEPGDYVLLGNLADAYRWDGPRFRQDAEETYRKAIALALKALAVNPRDTGALGALGTYNAKIGETAQAAEFIQRARAIDPNDVDLMYRSAVIDAVAERADAALQDVQLAVEHNYPAKALANDPDLRVIRNNPAFTKLLALKK